MDPQIWGDLPLDVYRHIASFADIDTRRAMGFKPRKLRFEEFNPKPMPPIEFRYYINSKKLWYFEMGEYGNFFFEVQTGIDLDDPRFPRFICRPGGRHRTTVYTETMTDNSDGAITYEGPFQTAGFPIWICAPVDP